jgi:hypothetical protein
VVLHAEISSASLQRAVSAPINHFCWSRETIFSSNQLGFVVESRKNDCSHLPSFFRERSVGLFVMRMRTVAGS